jgi:DNA-directed RNA polymerase specialized sigma24 family protein
MTDTTATTASRPALAQEHAPRIDRKAIPFHEINETYHELQDTIYSLWAGRYRLCQADCDDAWQDLWIDLATWDQKSTDSDNLKGIIFGFAKLIGANYCRKRSRFNRRQKSLASLPDEALMYEDCGEDGGLSGMARHLTASEQAVLHGRVIEQKTIAQLAVELEMSKEAVQDAWDIITALAAIHFENEDGAGQPDDRKLRVDRKQELRAPHRRPRRLRGLQRSRDDSSGCANPRNVREPCDGGQSGLSL